VQDRVMNNQAELWQYWNE